MVRVDKLSCSFCLLDSTGTVPSEGRSWLPLPTSPPLRSWVSSCSLFWKLHPKQTWCNHSPFSSFHKILGHADHNSFFSEVMKRDKEWERSMKKYFLLNFGINNKCQLASHHRQICCCKAISPISGAAGLGDFSWGRTKFAFWNSSDTASSCWGN